MARIADQDALIEAGPGSGDPFEGEAQVEGFRFVSTDGGFAVAWATLADGTEMPLAGPIAHLGEGERALVRGAVEDHPRHGLQITVAEAQPLDPAGAEGARRYLAAHDVIEVDCTDLADPADLDVPPSGVPSAP